MPELLMDKHIKEQRTLAINLVNISLAKAIKLITKER